MSAGQTVFGTYSFLDVNCYVAGPGLAANLANGSAAAEEGIDITPVSDINTMTIAADGAGMHSLHANQAAHFSVGLLKSSPWNAVLMTAYNLQTTTSALHGKNAISLVNPVSGDSIQSLGVAFKKAPDLKYAMEGDIVKWEFDAIFCGRVLGANY